MESCRPSGKWEMGWRCNISYKILKSMYGVVYVLLFMMVPCLLRSVLLKAGPPRITVVKQQWVCLVLGWATAWDHNMVLHVNLGTSIAMGCLLTGQGRFTIETRYLSAQCPDRLWTHPTTCTVEPEVFCQRVKWPGCETDHWPPYSAEVKNCGVILPLHNTSSWPGA
jgi:hypothetical protein